MRLTQLFDNGPNDRNDPNDPNVPNVPNDYRIANAFSVPAADCTTYCLPPRP